MSASKDRSIVVLLGLVAMLVAVASASGVLLRGALATVPFTSVRGEVVDSLVGGVYRFNGKAIAAEGIGWDLVTLCLAVPALLLAIPFVRRGSTRATLFAIGLLAYALYQYFEYATALAYGPLFPVYVAIVALSVTSIAVLLARIDLAGLRGRIGAGFPHRVAIGFGLYMAILLLGMWLPLLARTAWATTVDELDGATTLVVQAFDLGVLVPLGFGTALLVHRRRPAGYLLAAVVVVKGMAMGAGIAAMLIVEALATGIIQVVPIALFALTSIVSGLIAWRIYGSIDALSMPGQSVALTHRTGPILTH